MAFSRLSFLLIYITHLVMIVYLELE
jgi:hypothetical protein